MLTLTLTRKSTGDSGTFGDLILPDGTILKTGECPWRDNKSVISRIPVSAGNPNGAYLAHLEKTGKHPSTDNPDAWDANGVFVLQDVEGRTMCEIHVGNFCGDINLGYQSDVEGCIILGEQLGQEMTTRLSQNKMQDAVLSSTSAVEKFYKLMNGQDFLLVVQDNF